MLSRKMELIILVLLFIVLLSVSIVPITNIKQNYLPINQNLSVDDTIQKELQVKDNYVYKEIGRRLFVFYIPQGSKSGEIETAIKGTHSGYIFNIYGIKTDLINYSGNHLDFLKVNDDAIGSIYVQHTTDSEYIIRLQPNEKGQYHFTDTLNSNFTVLTLPSAVNEDVLAVIPDHLTQEYKIYCETGNQKIEVLSGETIKGWVG